MIPRNVIKKSDVQAAAEYIVANSLPNNSTKYDAELTIDGVVHRVAPKSWSQPLLRWLLVNHIQYLGSLADMKQTSSSRALMLT